MTPTARGRPGPESSMKLSDIISHDALIPQLRSDTCDGAIQELLDVLLRDAELSPQDSQAILHALLEREANGSTGFGEGVAVPHCQHFAIKKTAMAIGRSTAGLDFNALDKAPVYSVLLLLSPANDQDRHLQAMELVFRHLQRPGFRDALRAAASPEALRELIAGTEASEAN